METLVLKSNSRKHLKLLETLAKELGVAIEHRKNGKGKKTETALLSEKSLAKDWLSKSEEKVWKDL
jgi:hypothetical protein